MRDRWRIRVDNAFLFNSSKAFLANIPLVAACIAVIAEVVLGLIFSELKLPIDEGKLDDGFFFFFQIYFQAPNEGA